MNGAFDIGGTGLVSLQEALNIIANNVTNINTQGFKRSDVQFSEVMAGMSLPQISTGSNLAEPSLASVSVNSILMLDEQGEIEQTGRPLDLAIDGQGFIELMGPNGQSMLWRGGSLRVADDGVLVADNGLPLRDFISIPNDMTEIQIDADGTIRGREGNGSNVIEIGKLNLVNTSSPQLLERIDGGMYRADPSMRLFSGAAGEDGLGRFVQGSLERSNVDLSTEMVDMLVVQRAYAANAQIVQAADQLMSIANNLRR